MDVIPVSIKWQHVVVFIDDIVIMSMTPEYHIQHIEEVLRLLRDAGTPIKVNKCFFFSKTIVYLGHVIAGGKRKVVQKTTKEIELLQYSTTVSEILAFVEL